MRTLVDSFQSPIFRRALLEAVLVGLIAGAVCFVMFGLTFVAAAIYVS